MHIRFIKAPAALAILNQHTTYTDGDDYAVLKSNPGTFDGMVLRFEQPDGTKSVHKDASSTSRRIRFVASTASEDRDGDSIMPEGIDTSASFDKGNAPFLAVHDGRKMPIGVIVEYGVHGAQYEIEVDFLDPKDFVQPDGTIPEHVKFADMVFRMYKLGVMNAVSIGFIPLEWEPHPNGHGFKFTKVELLEVSAVPIPSNRDAMMLRFYGTEGGSEPLFAEGELDELIDALASVEAKRASQTPAEEPPTFEEPKGWKIAGDEVGWKTSVTYDGREIGGIRDITIRISPDQLVRAFLEVSVDEFDVAPGIVKVVSPEPAPGSGLVDEDDLDNENEESTGDDPVGEPDEPASNDEGTDESVPGDDNILISFGEGQ